MSIAITASERCRWSSNCPSAASHSTLITMGIGLIGVSVQKAARIAAAQRLSNSDTAMASFAPARLRRFNRLADAIKRTPGANHTNEPSRDEM